MPFYKIKFCKIIKKELLYPVGYKPRSEEENMELWIILTLSPLQQMLFKYLRIITYNGDVIVYVRLKSIHRETRLSVRNIQASISRLKVLNLINVEPAGPKGLEVDINPIEKWFKEKKKQEAA